MSGKFALVLCCAMVTVSTLAFADGLRAKAVPEVAPDPDPVGSYAVSGTSFDFSDLPTTVGTPTTLTGFYDWQSNGGQATFIMVNPANGRIHVVYMPSTDSANIGPSRTCAYAMSTDGGTTWNNFNNIQIPQGRASGYPSLSFGQGTIDGGVILANHNNVGGGLGNQTFVYVDIPEGGGAFAELPALPVITGTAQLIWPNVAGASDGSIVVHASPNIAPDQNYLTRTVDYVNWSTLYQIPGINDRGGRYPTRATSTGRVGTLLQAVSDGAYWVESTNNGASWAPVFTLHQSVANGGRVAGPDTFQSWVGADFVYNGNVPMIVIDELGIGANDPTDAGYIAFWSQASGWVEIARPQTTPGAILTRNMAQSNHFTMGWPTIGMSGPNLVVAWTVMQPEFSAAGFNYCDIYASMSTNGGASWTPPRNLTNTPNLDERYPSMSKWNQPGFANMVWQEDTQPGSHAFSDNAPRSRSWQVFYRLDLSLLTGVGEEETPAADFRLAQNYPNPFNPVTTIQYSVREAAPVTLQVFNALGQRVATLVNEVLPQGTYEVTFDGSALASGVYYYRMQAGNFVETRKMLLVK